MCQRKSIGWGIGILALGILAAACGSSPTQTPIPAGTPFPLQPASHISPGEPHPAYNSVPPTSGWHFPAPAPWGIYVRQLPDETIVHNLEHGGVSINHNLTDAASEARLIGFVQSQAGFPGCFIVQRHSEVARGQVVLTAWGWLQRFSGVDTVGMQRFVDVNKNNAPERFGPFCSG